MKIRKFKKFNENVENKYHIHIVRDEMGYLYTEIFESEEDMMANFMIEIIDRLSEYYKENQDVLEETLIELFSETNIESLIEKYNEVCDDLNLEEKHYYTRGEIKKPIKSREQIIKDYKLKMDVKKYNI